jgi:hyperosmotically inducible periplasmic protein
MTVKDARVLVLGMGHAMAAFYLAATLAACQTTHGQTAGQYMDDAAITSSVKSKLVSDKFANLTRIDVETTNGTVHLLGIVENPDQKVRAGKLATQVAGVKSVDNDLEIQHQ